MGVRGTPFWDRDSDDDGSTIRPDVRAAAQTVWARAQRMARTLLGDAEDAAEILESCIARVSRYLDRRQETMFAGRTQALLLLAFRQALQDLATKRRRLEFIGDTAAFEERLGDIRWQHEIDVRLDCARLLIQLSESSRKMLLLRNAGYEWSEIAALFGTTPSQSRTRLWRELQKLRSGTVRSSTQKTSREPTCPDVPNDKLSESIPPPD